MLRIPPPEDDGFALALIKMEWERSVGILGGYATECVTLGKETA